MFEQKKLFYNFFSSFKIMGTIKDINKYLGLYRQNIKNLVFNFWAIHVGNIHANFQVSSFAGVRESEVTDGRMDIGGHAIFDTFPIQKF